MELEMIRNCSKKIIQTHKENELLLYETKYKAICIKKTIKFFVKKSFLDYVKNRKILNMYKLEEKSTF